MECTIEVDAWPVKFEYKEGQWEGFDQKSIKIVLGVRTIQRLVVEERMNLFPVQNVSGVTTITLGE